MEGSSSIGEAYPASQLDNSGRSRDSYYDDIYHKASIDYPPNQNMQQQQQHDVFGGSNYQSNDSNNMDSMRSSGITSSHPSEATSSYNYSGTTTTNNSSSFRSRTTNNTSTMNTTTRTGGPSYFQPMKKDISLSGNPLTHVQESPSLVLFLFVCYGVFNRRLGHSNTSFKLSLPLCDCPLQASCTNICGKSLPFHLH